MHRYCILPQFPQYEEQGATLMGALLPKARWISIQARLEVNFVRCLLGGQPHFLAKTYEIQYNIHLFKKKASESAIWTSTIFVQLAQQASSQNVDITPWKSQWIHFAKFTIPVWREGCTLEYQVSNLDFQLRTQINDVLPWSPILWTNQKNL